MSLSIARRLAYGFGLFLAIAEVVRNWGDWQYAPFWIVDYIAVALLLYGAYASSPTRAIPRVRALAAGWGFTCAMFYMSFFGHLHNLDADTNAPVDHRSLTLIIGVMFAITILGLALSLSAPSPSRREENT